MENEKWSNTNTYIFNETWYSQKFNFKMNIILYFSRKWKSNPKLTQFPSLYFLIFDKRSNSIFFEAKQLDDKNFILFYSYLPFAFIEASFYRSLCIYPRRWIGR